MMEERKKIAGKVLISQAPAPPAVRLVPEAICHAEV